MPEQLPAFIFELLPPLYTAFTRILDRLKVTKEEMYSMSLLCNSNPLRQDFLDSLAAGMGYTDPEEAEAVLEALISNNSVIIAGDEQSALVTLTSRGNRRFSDVVTELQASAMEFLADQPPQISQALEKLFNAADGYKSLVPIMTGALARRPVTVETGTELRKAGSRRRAIN